MTASQKKAAKLAAKQKRLCLNGTKQVIPYHGDKTVSGSVLPVMRYSMANAIPMKGRKNSR